MKAARWRLVARPAFVGWFTEAPATYSLLWAAYSSLSVNTSSDGLSQPGDCCGGPACALHTGNYFV